MASLARSVPMAVAVWLALAASAGCYHVRTHEAAAPIARPEELARKVAARLPKASWRSDHAVRVAITYRPGEVDPLGIGERIAAELVPGWPWARGEWPGPETTRLRPVLERLLSPHFRSGPPDLLLLIRFGPATFRRYTRTVYGLSIAAGVLQLLGVPTDFATVSLEADVRLCGLDGGRAAGAALFERKIAAEATANGGTFLSLFPYNHLAEKRTWIFGPPPLRWEDLFAEALAEFSAALLRALEEALATE